MSHHVPSTRSTTSSLSTGAYYYDEEEQQPLTPREQEEQDHASLSYLSFFKSPAQDKTILHNSNLSNQNRSFRRRSSCSTNQSILLGETFVPESPPKEEEDQRSLSQVLFTRRKLSSTQEELQRLQALHQQKMRRTNTTTTTISEKQPQYDFCILLQPQNVYKFWADNLLDFRLEYYGLDVDVETNHQPSSELPTPTAVSPQQPPRQQTASSVHPLTHSAKNTPRLSVLQLETPQRRWGQQQLQPTPVLRPSLKKQPTVSSSNSIPNTTVPPGIARAQQWQTFLQSPPIHLRQHRPHQDAITIRMWREQDSLYYCYSIKDDNKDHHTNIPQDTTTSQSSPQHNEETLTKKLSSTTHVLRISDLVYVQLAQHPDPRTAEPAYGTPSLRKSNSTYNPRQTFSLVFRNANTPAALRTAHNTKNNTLPEASERWSRGQGSEYSFRYLDLETFSEQEYWILVRGFTELHREALFGRFHHQRCRQGLQSHYSRILNNGNLHKDEYHEPVTASRLEKLIVQWRKLDDGYMKGFVNEETAKDPPPPDFFLGFKSPGTAIWSRLRQAGFITSRVYHLNLNTVMIKLKCPSDRLMDVAEVLRKPMRLKDDDEQEHSRYSYAPFRVDHADQFQLNQDPTDAIDEYQLSFVSSIRQSLIDLMISSKIRDTGAQLGPSTDLGKMIRLRNPLHMKEKLNRIFDEWIFYWKEEYWWKKEEMTRVFSSRSSSNSYWKDKKEGSRDEDDQSSATTTTTTTTTTAAMPNVWTRCILGAFYQPLDSIEEYFGEKVAFYFAWLQHTSTHLVFLSVMGYILFMAQVSSGKWDHPLRPFFAMVIMLWTFVTLANWKKRANLLAHRWGTMNYKEQETTRPDFHGTPTIDEITQEPILVYPKWKRWLKYCVSFPLTLLFTGGTLLLILWVHANRDLQLARYTEQKSNSNSTEFEFHNFTVSAIGKRQPVASVELTRENLLDVKFWFIVIGMPSMLGLFLPLINLILMRISIILNDYENYRTESEYRTYLIIKVFSFRFVCYFATLYYYAFISIGTPQAVENGILRVGTGVLVYTTVAHWWQIFLQNYFPILIRRIRLRFRNEKLIAELRAIELKEKVIERLESNGTADHEHLEKLRKEATNKRILLDQAQDDTWLEIMLPPHDSFPEYIQAVVQFTFVSCFSVVLPLTPLICLLNYLISMRLDAYKLCKGRRRPLAEKTGGIGVWEHLLHIVAVISVLTNCWLMGFTNYLFTGLVDSIGETGVFAIVVVWEHLMLLVKYIMSSSMSELPRSVRDDLRREQHRLEQQQNSFMNARRRTKHEKATDEESQSLLTTPTASSSSTEEEKKELFSA